MHCECVGPPLLGAPKRVTIRFYDISPTFRGGPDLVLGQFVVVKSALERVFLSTLSYPTVTIIPSGLHIHNHSFAYYFGSRLNFVNFIEVFTTTTLLAKAKLSCDCCASADAVYRLILEHVRE